jgi:hypothetical protein
MGSDDDIQKLKRIIAESTAKIEQTKSVASKENQDPSKSLELLCVINSVLTPILLEASAASVPACPPPMTMTE